MNAGVLQFGTAGLRAKLGPGPTQMNRATVRRSVAGFAAYLRQEGAVEGGVVIGHDARHGSEEFAQEAAQVLTGAGISVKRLPGLSPTPLLAFAVRHLGAAAGIMVTASHNPPDENGLKLYPAGGAQILPPQDAEVTRAIEAVGPLSEVPIGDDGLLLGRDVTDAYVEAIIAELPPAPAGAGDLRVVYTPLHGVGGDLLVAAFAAAGLPTPEMVKAQAEPDGDFPTVKRPNPEEPGTLDLALEQAHGGAAEGSSSGSDSGVDLILANDPDADRLAVAVPGPDGWRVLSGNEIGVLLAVYRTRHWRRDPNDGLLITTIASSGLLEQIAADAGIPYRSTLTGFKWIMDAVAQAGGRRLLLGYEEALGYAVSDVVRDKDGISAAVAICRAALEARLAGRTLLDELDELARRFGVYATRQLSIELDGDGPQRAAAMMRALREAPPALLAGRAVKRVEDRLDGPPPHADVLIFAADDVRVVVRPSGTEPKLKAYLQAVEPVRDDGVVPAQARAGTTLDALTAEMRGLLQ